MTSDVVFAPMSSMTTQPPSSPADALSAFITASGATSTISGWNPAPTSAEVIASTCSVFAATMSTALSPFSVSPSSWRSHTISSSGNGMFCSIS